jgi:hypothetical protein
MLAHGDFMKGTEKGKDMGRPARQRSSSRFRMRRGMVIPCGFGLVYEGKA